METFAGGGGTLDGGEDSGPCPRPTLLLRAGKGRPRVLEDTLTLKILH